MKTNFLTASVIAVVVIANSSWASSPPNPTASDINGNTAGGTNVLISNTGNLNTGFGNQALYTNTTGSGNTAYGSSALVSNTIGIGNTANGYNSLYSNTEGN